MSGAKRAKGKQSSYRLFEDQQMRINNVVYDRTQAQTLDEFKRVEPVEVLREAIDLGLDALGYPLELSETEEIQ